MLELPSVSSHTQPLPVLARSEADSRSSRTRAVALGEFLAVGGLSFLLLPLAWLAERGLGLDAAELAVGFVMFHAAHLINDPHFSVTYLLFYRDARRRAFGDAFGRAQRFRYRVAGFGVPLVLLAWAGGALTVGSAPLLGYLIESMFALVGWHYVKQGFGVLSVLCARRGVRFTALERRLIVGHCLCAWLYAWASPAVPSREVEEKGVVYQALPHGLLLERVTFVAFALSALALVGVVLRKRRREGRWLPATPALGFFASVWLWTVYSSLDPLLVYVIPALHSLQYLYFVGLLRLQQAREAEAPPGFGPPARERLMLLGVSAIGLGWLLFHGLPGVLDGARALRLGRHAAANALGPTPFFSAAFACVNIHHYFMDAVIWRRENPETRALQAAPVAPLAE